jgi:hypothetical protein
VTESLRDTITALTDKAEAGEPLTEVKVETPVETPAETPPETQEPAGRTAGRARDEKGRLLPGKAEPVQAAVPEVVRPPKPSSWKKEYDEHWGKLDPKVAEYVIQREKEYQTGVSTYKQEWENAKPLLETLAPYYPDFQKVGLEPAQALSKLAQTHREMVASDPMRRLQVFARLANDYQVPLQALLDPQFAQQFAVQQQIQQQPQESPEQAARRVFSEMEAQRGVVEFGSRKDAAGNPAYPHYEAVRTKMAQLLESGLATDLEGAYHAAVKLDDELFQSIQAEKVKAEEAKRLEEQRKAVQAAKGNVISPKSATPASGAAGAKKGLRSSLEEAFEQHTSGRV